MKDLVQQNDFFDAQRVDDAIFLTVGGHVLLSPSDQSRKQQAFDYLDLVESSQEPIPGSVPVWYRRSSAKGRGSLPRRLPHVSTTLGGADAGGEKPRIKGKLRARFRCGGGEGAPMGGGQ